MKIRNKKIYLDYAGATPIDKEILAKINKVQLKFFANPSSIHALGVEAQKLINSSRKKIADLIKVHSDEIIFTGSGTESVALAILGMMDTSQKQVFLRSSDEGGQGARPFKKLVSNSLPHIVTTNIEHSAVLENCKNSTLVPVEANGIVNPKKIHQAIKKNTVLVSVCYANNEIGTIQPIREIAKEIRYYRKINKTKFPLFHIDACQAMNYLEIDNVEKLGIDLMSFNSSKIYGPKGVGILYKRRGIELSPIYSGGGQEFSLRPGTENIAGIFGIAEALEKVFKIKNKENKRLTILRDYLINQLQHSNILQNYKIKINGDLEKRLPNNINFSIPNFSSELLVIELDAKGICVSEKSACHSKDDGISHVIKALREVEGDNSKKFENSIRISLGQQTTKKDIDYLILSLSQILKKYQEWK